MATQELVELQKIVKLLKKQIEPTLAKVKRASKIKLKDLFKPENINERLNNFLDKLTVDDAIKGSAFLLLATLIYPFVYNLKPKGFWENVMKGARFLQWIGYIGITPFKDEDLEFDFGCLAVSIVTSYIFIYQGGNIGDIARLIIKAM